MEQQSSDKKGDRDSDEVRDLKEKKQEAKIILEEARQKRAASAEIRRRAVQKLKEKEQFVERQRKKK